MLQLRTKLIERREVARARKAAKRAERLFNSITPEELADMKRRSLGKTPNQRIVEALREMAASAVREKMIEDDVGISADMIKAVTADTVEDILSQMIEGDIIIDDTGTHQALRKILDDLREAVGEIEDRQANLKTLSYEELISYPRRADLLVLAFTGHFDLGTFIRLMHIHNFFLWLEETGTVINGDSKSSGEAEKCWLRGASETIVEMLSQGSCSVVQVAEAMGIDENAVTSDWEAREADANVTELHPTCR